MATLPKTMFQNVCLVVKSKLKLMETYFRRISNRSILMNMKAHSGACTLSPAIARSHNSEAPPTFCTPKNAISTIDRTITPPCTTSVQTTALMPPCDDTNFQFTLAVTVTREHSPASCR